MGCKHIKDIKEKKEKHNKRQKKNKEVDDSPAPSLTNNNKDSEIKNNENTYNKNSREVFHNNGNQLNNHSKTNNNNNFNNNNNNQFNNNFNNNNNNQFNKDFNYNDNNQFNNNFNNNNNNQINNNFNYNNNNQFNKDFNYNNNNQFNNNFNNNDNNQFNNNFNNNNNNQFNIDFNYNNNNQFNNDFNYNNNNQFNKDFNNNNNNQFNNDFNYNNNKYESSQIKNNIKPQVNKNINAKNNYPNANELKKLSPLNIDEIIKVSNRIKNLDYESLCKQSDNPIYDLVIDIKTILDLEKGWKINFYGNDENKQRILKKFDERNFVISVIGNSNRGKTYILNKISGFEEMKEGAKFSVQTKGLSIKCPIEKEFILMDTVGFNAPILLEDENINIREKENEENIDEKINEITRGQIITNYLLQNFIINEADILICMIGQITYSEQQFLNKIRVFCTNKKKLFIIHNLIHLMYAEEVFKYIKDVLKKVITCNLEERNIPNNYSKKLNQKGYYNKYFVEINKEEGEESNLIHHFILVNDNIPESDYFNDSTIEFIRNVISHGKNQKHENIIERLRKYVIDKSELVLLEKINDIILKDGKMKVENQKIKPKSIAADELDNLTFISNGYNPNYSYYKTNKHFCIEIAICGKVNINYDFKYIENNKKIKFHIWGEKYKFKTHVNSIYNNSSKRKYGKFNISFEIDMKEYSIKGLQKNPTVEMIKGLAKLNYDIISS